MSIKKHERKVQKPHKLKANIIQYLLVFLLASPIMFIFGYYAETKWKISDFLMIFIMVLVLVVFWLAWVGIRSLYRKRSKRIMQEKIERRQNKSK